MHYHNKFETAPSAIPVATLEDENVVHGTQKCLGAGDFQLEHVVNAPRNYANFLH